MAGNFRGRPSDYLGDGNNDPLPAGYGWCRKVYALLQRRTRMRMSRTSGTLLAGFLAGGLAVMGAAPAFAHDVVVGGDPADGESVEQFPESVTLEFSGIPRDGFNTFAISDAETEEVLFTGEPTIDDRYLTLELPEDLGAGAGDYRIGFQITSSDGHATRGMTSFTVSGDEATAAAAADEAEAEAATPIADTPEEQGDQDAQNDTENTENAENTVEEATGLSGVWTWVIAGVAILAIIAVIIVAIQRGRVSRELDDHPENN